jgi:hypothetical protein
VHRSSLRVSSGSNEGVSAFNLATPATSVSAVDFQKLASSVQGQIVQSLAHHAMQFLADRYAACCMHVAMHDHFITATGRFDLRLAQGQSADVSSMDVDKASLQEIVDKLSVMVLHLHNESLHLRAEAVQLRDENAKMNSTLTVLNERLDKLSPVTSSKVTYDDLMKTIASIGAAGEFNTSEIAT